MKKVVLCLLVICFSLLLSGCGNKEYVGYWCRYDEVATIIVLLNDNITNDQKKAINDYIDGLENVASSDYYSKERYAEELGKSVSDFEEGEIYANYFVTFSSLDNVGTYVSELSKMAGVKDANQSDAKDNMNLYSINKDKTYTYTDSDEADSNDVVKGTYKIKKGIIIFTPDNDKLEEELLYTKDGYLCKDADCTKIFFKSDESCKALED